MLEVKPIGYVYHGYTDEQVRRAGAVEAFVEVDEEYAEALGGIDGFSHLILVTFMHKAQRLPLRTKPVRIFRDVVQRLGVSDESMPEVGVFAVASPFRPNPIALTTVHLLKRSGRVLFVAGCDCFSGTPVLDIKPLTSYRFIDPDDYRVPDWQARLDEVFEILRKHHPHRHRWDKPSFSISVKRDENA
ncbi:SAM-dependent methyltransferase [Infirmifilum sp. NZ]|uniref:SAM-dependent methyltransferase n=1 Tax=Infirmifilum sp. NZ TaxID=2926850 RepID=UPI0027997A9E|nr:SAM-dependent methyltransferase [Infirmifilum sp. NZ]UNQ73467.1 SAM-dependent methyltransferase [Infirmifilum sp. NZ]